MLISLPSDPLLMTLILLIDNNDNEETTYFTEASFKTLNLTYCMKYGKKHDANQCPTCSDGDHFDVNFSFTKRTNTFVNIGSRFSNQKKLLVIIIIEAVDYTRVYQKVNVLFHSSQWIEKYLPVK